MVVWADQLTDDPTSTLVDGSAPSTGTTEPSANLVPVVINTEIARSSAVLTGSLPDEGARTQLVGIAEDAFGRGNVLDELTIDTGVDLASGTVNLRGTAETGDEGPERYLLRAEADLGLQRGEYDVAFTEPSVDPAAVLIAVDGDAVMVTGTVPDEITVRRVMTAAEAVYGEGKVDGSGLEIGQSTMDGATITIEGVTAPGDLRAGELTDIATIDFPSSMISNITEVDVSEVALGTFEEELAQALEENPILFDVGTSRITNEGVANLVAIFDAIGSVPDLDVEIVGHTDSDGGDTVNQTLSESRALAVRDALIELGTAEDRLTTRGAGSSEPIASNATREGRARNRRIEFNFERPG